MASWESFIVKVPIKDPLEKVRNLLETVMVFLDILKAILETVKAFLVDFGNPIIALVREIMALIEELFESLKQTGLYGYFDVPDPTTDPDFDKIRGGYEAFLNRFKASLFNSSDPHRPQPRMGSNRAGLVLLVVDASSPYTLLRLIENLLRFFGREFMAPQYAPPSNVKALAIGDDGDPILAVAKVFSSGIKAVAVEWSLPSVTRQPDPGFQGLVANTAHEFWAPKFLVEKSAVPVYDEIPDSQLNDEGSAGIVTYDQPTTLQDNVGKIVKRKARLTDTTGEPFVKFQKYFVVSPTSNPGTFFMGQLGKFRFIDTDIQPDVKYYYRVRAFSGDLAINGDQIHFKKPEFTPESTSLVLRWPSRDPQDRVVMGKPSSTVEVRVPLLPNDFDVLENLRALFLTAFALNFHMPVTEDVISSPIEVGRGSLSDLAGNLAQFKSVPVLGSAVSALTPSSQSAPVIEPDPVTGLYPELPWQKGLVQYQAARLMNLAAGALLDNGSHALEGFRHVMQGPLPEGPISTGGTLEGVSTLEKLVFNLTEVNEQGNVSFAGYKTYAEAFNDRDVRYNVLAGINYLKPYLMSGTTGSWLSVSVLRDIVPWSGQFLYDLLAKIEALLAAFRGVFDEIKAFIETLERKINALENFIQFLLNILTFIEMLQIGVHILKLEDTDGGVQDWIRQIDSAGGNPPPSGPGGYSCGIGLAYVAPNVGPFRAALDLIF